MPGFVPFSNLFIAQRLEQELQQEEEPILTDAFVDLDHKIGSAASKPCLDVTTYP